MGAVRLIYDETTRELKELGWCGVLNLASTRKVMEGNLRYCLQGNNLYLPKDQSIIEAKHRLCWGRIRSEEFDEFPWLREFDVPLDVDPLDFHQPFTGIGFGSLYSRRHQETDDGRIPVRSFISQSVIEAIANDADVLLSLNKIDFEALIAELFARMGFEIDLYRGCKDDGIDFLRVDVGEGDPIIFCVQCKHPDTNDTGKKRRPLPVAVVREIYGVAKAHDLAGCIAVSSSTYTIAAKKFADLKSEEIFVASAEDVMQWVRDYRWNCDE